jgi:signal transduction histidine kinase
MVRFSSLSVLYLFCICGILMRIKRDHLKPLEALKRMEFDRTSLQLRLTIGITTIALLGVGSVGTWTTWKMRQMLVGDHKKQMSDVASQIAQELMTTEASLSAAEWRTTMKRWAMPNTWIAVKSANGEPLAQTGTLVNFSNPLTEVPWPLVPMAPTVQAVNDRYLILCRAQLQPQDRTSNQRNQTVAVDLYLARDITYDYGVLSTLVNTVRFGTLLALGVIVMLVALYIRRSLRPLRQMNRMATAQASTRMLLTAQTAPENMPSEMQGLAQAMSLLTARLSESGERQREFTNGLSHELRTSLSLIQGYLKSTLRRGDNLTAAQREALEVAASEADRTIQLLKDLLDLGRMSSRAVEFHLKPVVLNDAVYSAVEMFDPQGERRIEVEAESPQVVAQADPDHLNRVLMHLLKNAKQFSKPDQPIRLRLQQTADWAIIHIQDRGCGIPEADQPHIFEPFYRVEASRCRATGGMGLGLAIVRSLVEAMAGEVTVESTLGTGSCFTVKLPVGKASTSEAASVGTRG